MKLAITGTSVGSGVGTRRHTKKLRFQQIFRNGRHVHPNEGLVGPGRYRVNRLGQNLLAGTGFPQQQHWHVPASGQTGTPFDFQGSGTATNKVPKAVTGAPGLLRQRLAGGGEITVQATVF